jgi:hypothetical protein
LVLCSVISWFPSRFLVWLAETPYRDQTVRSNEIKSGARGKPADLCLPRGSTGGIFGVAMGFAVARNDFGGKPPEKSQR